MQNVHDKSQNLPDPDTFALHNSQNYDEDGAYPDSSASFGPGAGSYPEGSALQSYDSQEPGSSGMDSELYRSSLRTSQQTGATSAYTSGFASSMLKSGKKSKKTQEEEEDEWYAKHEKMLQDKELAEELLPERSDKTPLGI